MSSRLDVAGLFIMIGADPSTTWLHEVGVELDAKGLQRLADLTGTKAS